MSGMQITTLLPERMTLATRLVADPDAAARALLASGMEAAIRVPIADSDPMVRALLGARLAAIPARHATPETGALLECLASDPEVLVRAAIAEALKRHADAPHALVRRLAGDRERAVAEALLRYSPVLTEQDLLTLFKTPPGPETRLTIARRIGVGGAVVAEIINQGDLTPIAALLDNETALISEDEFAALLDMVKAFPAAGPLLASRSELPEVIALELADLLEGEPLVALGRRGDLPRDTLRAIRGRLATRLAQPATIAEGPEAAQARATQLHRMGLLSESITWAAAQQLQVDFVATALSLLSGVEPEVVARIRQRADRHAASALAARAGLSAGCIDAVERILVAAEPPLPVRRRSRLGMPIR